MDAVFDTNVLVYALLGVSEFRESAITAIGRAGTIWVPDLVRAEVVNVLWQWVHAGEVELETALDVLNDADALLTHVVPTNDLWMEAIQLSVDRTHPAYDSLFVVLAAGLGLPVVSQDSRLRVAFPEHVLSLAEFLARLDDAGAV